MSVKEIPTGKRYFKRFLVIGAPSDWEKRFWPGFCFWQFLLLKKLARLFFDISKIQNFISVLSAYFNEK